MPETSMAQQTRQVHVLLVEDNPGDVRLTREGIEAAGFDVELDVVQDGEAALTYLKARTQGGQGPAPDLILLDLNLPLMDGHEVLAHLQDDPLIGTIPVVVLTTSEEQTDVEESYRLNANSVVTKPMDYDTFIKAIAQVARYWLSVVRSPAAVR